jgi:DNA-binding NarL/FixJ family response regulator
MPIRILIADDDSPIRRLLRRLIEEHSEWEVCGEAVNGLDAVTKTGELHPDLVVLDLAMPQMNGLQAARQISQATPNLPMLLLTVQEVSTELVNEARNAGFKGAVSKSTGSEVVKGVETLLQQENFFRATPSDLPVF